MSGHQVYICLGGNIGDVESTFASARQLMQERIGQIINASSLYWTEPVGNIKQDWYLNQVIVVETDTDPLQVLRHCLSIEAELGRTRGIYWGPRLIDLDVLFYDQEIVYHEDLILPHPELDRRRFVLIPLIEIAPELMHPVHGKSMMELLNELNQSNRSQVVKKD